jgi:DNA-binding NarL/FixJ family response regulator
MSKSLPERVYDMYQQGISIPDIAKDLESTNTSVRTMISNQRRRLKIKRIKIDLPEASVERLVQRAAQMGVHPEDLAARMLKESIG